MRRVQVLFEHVVVGERPTAVAERASLRFECFRDHDAAHTWLRDGVAAAASAAGGVEDAGSDGA